MHQQKSPSLLTIAQLTIKYPSFSQASLRAHVFNAQERTSSQGTIPGNGLAPAIIRVGRKILIDETLFIEWVRRHQVTTEVSA